MKWKKTFSISMAFLLAGGLIFDMRPPIISNATSIYEGFPSDSPVITTLSTLESKENEPSSRSSVESNTSAGTPETNPGSGSEGSSSSGSSSDDSHSSSDNSDSGSSDHSTGGESSSGSDTSSDSDDSNNKEDSEASSDSDTSSDSDSTNKKDKNKKEKEKDSNKKDSKKDPKKDTTTPVKKIEEDDSNGRDYQESEVVSSGNTSFTIVSVVREDKKLEKKLKELRKKKKIQEKELQNIENILYNYSAQIEEIQNIYNMVYQDDLTFNESELFLTGYKKDCSFFENTNCIKGMDAALYKLAHKYHNQALLSWLQVYSTERSPFPEGYSPIDVDSDLISNVDSLLQEMLLPCTNWIVENQKTIDDLANGLDDTKEHIEKLKAAKNASAIQVDSRLVEYKDKIPDQCVEFLNAIVAKEGTPYVWGASGPNSFDCSGLISYGLRQCNAVSSGFRWTSIDFATQLRSIPFSEAKPGDLVWKKGHIAVYIDENTVFEAPYTGAHIRFTSCNVSSRFSRALRWWSKD
ncbi:MAG: NlpC/P60 family protein [Eubacteriales bacterium]|nr:NlpC/P60 family protein [Eubacteriales bacterium]